MLQTAGVPDQSRLKFSNRPQKSLAAPLWSCVILAIAGLLILGLGTAAFFFVKQFLPPSNPPTALSQKVTPPSNSNTPISRLTASPSKAQYAPTYAPLRILTRTQLASLSTPAQIFITETPAPSPTAPPVTQPPGAQTIKGAAVLAKTSGQMIVFGQRSAGAGDEVFVVDNTTLEEVPSQKGIKEALSGRGPQLFAYLADQKFTSDTGAAALADISLGSTENPDISIAFMWTSNIDGLLPAVQGLNTLEQAFSVTQGQAVDQEGWLQWGNVWLADKNKTSGAQVGPFPFFLFHHNQDIFILGFLPGSKYTLPAGDQKSAGASALSGQNHSYYIKGYKGGVVRMPIQGMFPGEIPILIVNELEKKR
jgi:hypothetical protein